MLKMFRKSLTNRKGFTLIELLVVVAIIGILAAIAVPKFSSASNAAKVAKIQADLRTIDSAAAIYNANVGSYPTSATIVSGASATLTTWPVPPASAVTTTPAGTGVASTYDITASGRATYGGATSDTVK